MDLHYEDKRIRPQRQENIRNRKEIGKDNDKRLKTKMNKIGPLLY